MHLFLLLVMLLGLVAYFLLSLYYSLLPCSSVKGSLFVIVIYMTVLVWFEPRDTLDMK